MKNQIKISIEGGSKSGKTFLKYLLEDLLEESGLINIYSEFNIDEESTNKSEKENFINKKEVMIDVLNEKIVIGICDKNNPNIPKISKSDINRKTLMNRKRKIYELRKDETIRK